MRLSAHLILFAVVVLDLCVRAWRLVILQRALGFPVRFVPAFVVNLVGEAAAIATPMRVGIQPVRIATLSLEGVPLAAAAVAVAVEAVLLYAAVILVGAVLGVLYAPDWWPMMAARLSRIPRLGLWLSLALVALVLAAWGTRRLARRLGGASAMRARDALLAVRRLPAGVIAGALLLSIADVVASVAILPLMVLGAPSRPPLGIVAFGSFTLVYGQIVTPTPGGAGPVELMFLGGGAGDLGPDAGRMLLEWRFYTVGLVAIGGILVALVRYGPALKRWIERRRAST